MPRWGWHWGYEILTLLNKDKEAVNLYTTFVALKDSINSSKQKTELAQLEVGQEIKEQDQKDELEKVKQTNARNVKTFYYSSSALLLLLIVFVTANFYKQKASNKKLKQLNETVSKERERSEELLLNILPSEVAEELKETGSAKAKSFESVTVLFTDFKNFTQASENLSAEDLVKEINYCYSEFDRIVSKYGIEKIKTIGDSYMCAGGLPTKNETHPADLVNAGLELQQFIISHNEERIKRNEPYFELRIGIHTGAVVAGIVGIKKFAYDIWGDTVNTASRMESSGEEGKVNISGATYELVKDEFVCVYRGKVRAKNKGEIDMYFVEGKV